MCGKLHIYTGNGKGKTTAALGLAVRAACAGKHVYIGQFMKGRQTSELHLPEYFPEQITIVQYGSPKFQTPETEPSPEDIDLANSGLSQLKNSLVSEEFDVVVADELCIAVSLGLLNEEDVLHVIKQKPSSVELVLTGRNAPNSFIELADLVTEMKEIKHYYSSEKLPPRKGIEF